MNGPDQTRRRLLRKGGLLSVVGLTGCLRLTEEAEPENTDNQRSTVQLEGTPTSGEGETDPTDDSTQSSVELTILEEFTDTPVGGPVSHESEFYSRSDIGPARIGPDGEIAWSAPGSTLPQEYYLSKGVAFSSDTAFFALETSEPPNESPEPGVVVAFDKTTGNKQWEFTVKDDDLHDALPSLAAVSSDILAVAAATSGAGDIQEPLVYGLDPATGEQLWRTSEFPADHITNIFEYDGRPYVVMVNGIYSCDSDTGAVTRIRDIHSGLGTPTAIDDTLYLPGQSVQAFHLDDEEVRWKTEIDGHIYTQPVVTDGRVFVGTRTGFVYGIDTSDGTQRWESRILSRSERMAVTSNHLWVADDIGMLYAFTLQDGEKVYEEEQAQRTQRGIAAIDNTLLITRPDQLVEVE